MNAALQRWRSALVLKWLWLVHVYPFNWAHKPLCARFRRDVVRIGPVHLCRSCLLAYGGILSGILAAISGPSYLQAYGTTIFVSTASVTILFSLPLWYKRWPRLVRDLLRFSMGLSIAMCGFVLVRGHFFVGLAGAFVLAAFWRVYLALRRRRRLDSCAGCPELDGRHICSGFRRQAEGLRTYEEKATLWLLHSGASTDYSREM